MKLVGFQYILVMHFLRDFFSESLPFRPLNELSSFMWANKIFNFIILRNCNNITGDVHSYFPFANAKCREFSEENIQKLGTFYFNTSGW